MQTIGPLSRLTYEAVQDDREGFWYWRYTDADGRQWCPSVGFLHNRRPTPEAALAWAVEEDILVAIDQLTPHKLNRAQYEAACEWCGLQPMTDVDTYWVRYGQPTVSEVGVANVAALKLAGRHLLYVDDVRKEAETITAKQMRAA